MSEKFITKIELELMSNSELIAIAIKLRVSTDLIIKRQKASLIEIIRRQQVLQLSNSKV